MSNLFIGLGALSAFVSVAAGAFGAHALKQTLDADMLAVYHTAVDYQFFHSLGLIVIGTLQRISPRRCHRIAAWIMLAGIIIFSGSLYLLSLSGTRWLGMVTPIGGVGFLLAWLILASCYLMNAYQRDN
ncbi:MAG: DUF423 domain-containing protein [Gammaproteobacteria bacterium]|nr:DUF423 domain-containing protein [Gammaproteobacteria bacterium]